MIAEARGRITIVGASLAGLRAVQALRREGFEGDVTLVGAAPYPMHAGLGEEASRWLAAHHERNGVELVSQARVTAVDGGLVLLSDGRSLAADLVVGGMGVVPNTEWLDGALAVNDGALCGPTLFAQGADNIVAAGDVARWPHGLFGGEMVRVEHWSNANEQGAVAARNLLTGPENAQPFLEVPNFATHVHGARIQTAGLPHLADSASIVTGSPEEDRFAVAFTRDGVLVGALAVNSPKELIKLKRAITARETAARDA
ncbi:FAD-dependent oxidoreductase [Nonomuraea sp. 3-1Str]|uniref:FAD-dependent oxidoreductase n=1 Tax=Nonomuraea sp. 3-1Str TaxID=2929801 RepID=UPI002863EAAA|nr:FAD-dependent oxidoreductase [Nonomuraea sp. 3-1Str]MDR8411736.1 FAD-dependent oxidoreductase [Nonomuraea sp. 3-1Str]